MSKGRKPLKLDDIPTLELESTAMSSAQSDPNINVQACYPNNCPPVTSDDWTCYTEANA